MVQIPSLTVAIPTKNRPVDLAITLESLWKQSVSFQQLVIIDQSDGDESKEVVRSRVGSDSGDCLRQPEVCYVYEPSLSGLTAARNRALQLVRTDVVLFLDDDVILEPDFIERILEAYSQFPQAIGVSGIVTNYTPPRGLYRVWSTIFVRGPMRDDRQPVYWRAAQLTNGMPVRVSRLGGGLMSFKLEAIRGFQFDENLRGACEGEDVDFTVRLRPEASLYITPKARLIHKQTPISRGAEHWLFRHCRTHWYLYRRHWNHGLWNRITFVWLNVGYSLATFIVSLRQMSLMPWRNFPRAIREAHRLAACTEGS